MLLSARILSNLANVNTYQVAEAVQFRQGDAVSVYLQLTDASVQDCQGGRRYVPADGAVLQISILPLDCGAKIINRVADQPFDGDASIFNFQILPTDGLRGTQDLNFRLIEGNTVRTGVIRYGISAQALNSGREGW